MKTTTFRIISVFFFLSLSLFSVYSTEYPLNQQSGTISLTTDGSSPSYRANLNNTYIINTGVLKPVKFAYDCNLNTNDIIYIYTLTDSNTPILMTQITGQGGGRGTIVTTTAASGKAKVVFVTGSSAPSSSNYGTFSFSVENNSSVSGDLSVTGSSTFSGGITSYGTSRILKASVGSLSGSTTQALNVKGIASIATDVVTPDEQYKGSLMITRPAASGQYINLVRKGQYPWSIGMVYNTNNFAIGQGNATDASFTNPFLTIKGDNGNVGIGTTTPNSRLESVTGINALPATSGAAQTGAALRLRGGDNAVLDFGVNSTNTWLQATDQTELSMKYYLCLNPNGGNVGVGKVGPSEKLDVVGNVKTDNSFIVSDNTTGLLVLKQQSQYCSNDFSFQYWTGSVVENAMTIQSGTGHIGIGTTIPNTKLGVGGDIQLRALNAVLRMGNGDQDAYFGSIGFNNSTNNVEIKQMYNSGGILFNTNTNSTRMLISSGGKVGIGTTNPDSLLTVNGSIHAKAVVVDLAVPADYVFKSDYKLMPLHQVEQFVKTNSHLPEIPSADEIVKNGLNMGEMQNKLLQKVEELTLYVIELQKRIECQNAKIEQMEKTANK